MCHTHCDTGLPFIMVISENPWHSHLLPVVWQWSCHYLFFCRDRGSNPDLPYARRTLCLFATAEVIKKPNKTFEVISRGIYSMSTIFLKQYCHRNFHFGAGFFLSIVALDVLENNLSSILLSILTQYNLSLYINRRFLEIWFCLFVVFSPTWKCFTYMETSSLPVKGCKFWPMLGTRGHWAVRVLWRATSTVRKAHPFITVISEDPWHSHLLLFSV